MNTLSANARFEKIVVPVDFSECSRSAVEFGSALAKCFGSQMFLVHVVDPCVGTGDLLVDIARLQVDREKEATEELERWAAELQPQPTIMVRTGSPAHQILEATREIGATVIVIPSHGRSAIARFFIGGVAERVVRHASCPVIVLPWKKFPDTNQILRTQSAQCGDPSRRTTEAI